MKNKRSKVRRVLLSGLLLAISWHAIAQVDETSASIEQPPQLRQAVPDANGSTPVMLSDKLHQINNSLESTTAVHQYDFTAVRGQNVLITAPDSDYNQKWKLEYQVEGGEWQPKRHNGAEKVTGLNAGAQVSVRILATDGAVFDSTGYRVVFGSFPHLNYDLHHEAGFRLIPYGFTDPPFLATHALTEAMLESTFTDSKAFPLEGGVMGFFLEVENDGDMTYTSDSSGKIMQLIKFGQCEGGTLADNFTYYSENGRETWSTRYQVKSYRANNVLPEQLADKPHTYNFGHVCKRWLTNWSRN
ncbi:hypothetical protein ALP45_02966 [Pseudomonas coronafaciens pv. atropurpurea]|uniref:hypothetical protein n=1 Tax=Pseudomonas coronafaciens TaxID=53409 RepID=UPI0006D5FED3|nr:hypothetical protein [Pseudomonas coronafaciens]KPW37525.1 Uncharacterized protein ALO66_03101 [Pseudomonas coronafaciens pv. atropurpurea]RMT57929.1 hypothetical protein ALP45_02966 [Pseudomonas coronafaciens pv. atropurpurea]